MSIMSVAQPTRREFAAALAASALAACTRTAHTTPTPVATPAPPTTSATPAAASADSTRTPDPAAPQADALLAVVVARYGAFIPEANRAEVRNGIRGTIRLADRLRATPITNAVDPFSSLVPVAPTAGGPAR
jgi:hypothetical protein